MAEIKRKLYKRGSSFETTIPRPLLFATDQTRDHNVVFRFNAEKKRWYVDFEPVEGSEKKEGEKGEIEEEKRTS